MIGAYMLVSLVACGVSYCIWQRTAEGLVGDERMDFSGGRLREVIVRITVDVSRLKAAFENLAVELRRPPVRVTLGRLPAIGDPGGDDRSPEAIERQAESETAGGG